MYGKKKLHKKRIFNILNFLCSVYLAVSSEHLSHYERMYGPTSPRTAVISLLLTTLSVAVIVLINFHRPLQLAASTWRLPKLNAGGKLHVLQ